MGHRCSEQQDSTLFFVIHGGLREDYLNGSLRHGVPRRVRAALPPGGTAGMPSADDLHEAPMDSQMLANAGTVFVLKALGHFLIGNILLGLVEGVILARVFRSPRRRAVGVMVGANYASALLGGFLTSWFFILLQSRIPVGGYIRWMMWVLPAAVAFSFVVTVLMEWPFAARVAGPAPRRWRRSFLPVLGVHLLTYPLLGAWYWSSADLSLYTSVRHDHSLSFVKPSLAARAWVYFVDPAADGIYRIRMDGGMRERVAGLPTSDTVYRRLFLWPSDPQGGEYLGVPELDLWLTDGSRRSRVATGVARGRIADPEIAALSRVESVFPAEWWEFRPVDLRPEESREWVPEQNSLSFRRRSSGEAFRAGLFHRWYRGDEPAAFAPIMVSEGVVVAAVRIFGGDPTWSEIVVLDLDKRVLGVLTAGASPVVVLEASGEEEE